MTALITGASRGIGKAIALELASLGYELSLVGREAPALESVQKECSAKGVRAEIIQADLSEEKSWTGII